MYTLNSPVPAVARYHAVSLAVGHTLPHTLFNRIRLHHSHIRYRSKLEFSHLDSVRLIPGISIVLGHTFALCPKVSFVLSDCVILCASASEMFMVVYDALVLMSLVINLQSFTMLCSSIYYHAHAHLFIRDALQSFCFIGAAFK